MNTRSFVRLAGALFIAIAISSVAACSDIASPTRPSGRRPLVSTLSPARGMQGSTMAVTITGSNFSVASKASIVMSGDGVTVTSVAVRSSGTATVQLEIAADAVPGTRTLTMRTIGGVSEPLTFTVISTDVPGDGS